ncbi:MAG: peptidoglycan DD-metalloendopeptidase family protein [Flavobacteriales bacterium]|nr:peptidoglycan DD-metalloendopeptidase family protein [Flavobacteriales bacterium]
MGGPEGNMVYAEDVSVELDGAAVEGVWDIRDSLAYIPAYDLYCGWNTASIFSHQERSRLSMAPSRIQLSHAPCDHFIPICGRITSSYGPRRGRMHYGVDLKLEKGDPVRAAFEGMVRISRYNRSFGHVVVVRHPNGLETLYAHLSERSVQVGDLIQAGDTLGLGGNTGRSTGSHLHFEVRYLGRAIDPAEIFDLNEGELRSNSYELPKTWSSHTANYHKVIRGETLTRISQRYGTTVSALCKLNGLSVRSVLRVGQVLRTQ